uniref:Zinc finger CCCH-type containing 7A n=1 Tax=Cyprinus carpio TaxID=7962 RepID=A0A8C1QAC2_CYPCA
MSATGQDRSSRWQDIQKGLQFIQSTLPFPGPQEQYEVFIQSLVRNLFGEGNDVFLEGEWTRSVELYTEALNIAEYAESEDIIISQDLKEKLYANRAASYLNIGLHDQALEDSEKALQLNESNYRALYRKARCLKEMGRHQEAYEVVAKCSMAVPQDTRVIEMTQELAKMLGLKIRKAYVRSKVKKKIINRDASAVWLICCLLFQLSNSDMSVPTIPPIGMGFCTSDGTFMQDYPPQLDLAKNPLADTHEFKQACSSCYIKTGPGVLDYAYHPEDHKCKKDLLLGRTKHSELITWKLIRPRPTKNQYMGPYYICKDVAMGQECRYLGHCTFAYCQEEIDVWTLERKGFICRENLCDPHGFKPKINLTVPKILQEHHGIFMFLCEVCFDHKPRIISKTNKDIPGLCSHPVTKHVFEEKKCLVHYLRDKTIRYSKIRPYFPHCQMDLCRHEVRYGCQREDFCFYAHSLIELKVWMMQSEKGITHEGIVQESQKYWNMDAYIPVRDVLFGPANLKMQFVCAQCWRNGQVSEPDKNKKYCSAKARHPWSKERRVVLVSSIERKKWTTVRCLPTKKPIPAQFEVSVIFLFHAKKTSSKLTFIADMEQLYEMWLQSQKPGWSEESSSATRDNGKQIHMPTDYAEEVAGNHCWLCGKNCNSDKQWQQHITSEKHKERVFNSEDDQNCWQYRFPTGTFRVCERFLKGTCTEEELCKLAHGDEELKEWKDRREFLLMKLAKARKDHLIAPNDNDFGKYSFLLKDIK